MSNKFSLTNIKKVSNRVIDNWHNIKKDAALIGEHALSIPNIAFPLISDKQTRSEIDPRNYKSVFDLYHVLRDTLIPAIRLPISEGTLVCYPNEAAPADGSKWFFLNGIATPAPVAVLNGKEVARIFRRPITLIHTPTYSVLLDLYQSFIARTLRKDGNLSKPAFDVIIKALRENEKVVLVCHSQGAIISSYIARNLKNNPEDNHLLEKLEIYTVAGVADSFKVCETSSKVHNRPVPYVEHFANDQDFFSLIGTLAYEDNTDGKLFRNDKKGHLFNDHYIGGIMRGDYCNGESRLYKYVGGGQPTDSDYHSH